MTEQEKLEILRLFNKKNFIDLELRISKIIKKEKPTSFLLNLLGISKLQKKNTLKKDSLEALKLFKKSYNLNPNYLDTLFNYALLGLNLNDYEEPFEKLKEISKKGFDPKVELTLSRIYFFRNDIKKAHELLKKVINKGELTYVTSAHFLTTFNYIYPFNQKEYLKYCKIVNDRYKIPEYLKKKIDFKTKKIDFDKIKVGFISPDFCDHAIAQFLIGTLEELKKYKLELHGFNLRNPKSFDHKTNEYKNLFDKWHDLSPLDDPSSAKCIKNERIDVLIDICGYFARNRLLILKYRPAPIQILWLGYLNSTGTDYVDYLVADPNLIQDQDEEKLYTEKVLKMPNIWNCHSKIDLDIKVNKNPFIKNKFFTFGCLNNSTKISYEVLIAWSEILLNTSNTKFIIKSVNTNSEKGNFEILEFFKKKKINLDRIVFLKKTKTRKQHLETYNKIDLALDTFPYPGITTSFESVYMGVPFLTLKGQNFLSRAGESINKNLNLQKFIAKDQKDYVDKAIATSKNHNYLIDLRKNLRNIALNSPLFDMKKFGKEFNLLIYNICKKNELNKK